MNLRNILKLFLMFGGLSMLSACSTMMELFEEGADLTDPYASEAEFCNYNSCDGVDSLDSSDPRSQRIREAIESRDIVLGMTRSQVVKSWGEPKVKEFAGSGNSGHERWTYGSQYSLRGQRTIIFEQGQVAGWNQ